MGTFSKSPTLPKNLFILWLQGWNCAPALHREVAESWRINNPDWNIHLIDQSNLSDYIDVPYLSDPKKTISPQARSDIIRLHLLAKWGGVWADATLLCMQPLDHWVHAAVEPAGLWMYHGHGAQMPNGPASWFIVSKQDSFMIRTWKEACDAYWTLYDSTNHYFWMDGLFRELYLMNTEFAAAWDRVPYLYCELDGQSHTLAKHGMHNDTPHIKHLFETAPPYVLKFWAHWNPVEGSNGHFALQMAKRRMEYRHLMQETA